MRLRILFLMAVMGLTFLSVNAWAEMVSFTIVIKDHKFTPEELTIPANEKVKLFVENHDATAEEFESYDLNREKIVIGNGKIILFIGPLKPGTYKYFGDFHQDTAQGTIVVADNSRNEEKK